MTSVFKRDSVFNPWMPLLTQNIIGENAYRKYYMDDSRLLENSSENQMS